MSTPQNNSPILEETDRSVDGHDKTAINRHSERSYKHTVTKQNFKLSRNLDGCPPFFEAFGPFDDDFVGITPKLLVQGKQYWGDGLSWNKAFKMFEEAVKNLDKTT